jgi:hypothetical protein
MCDDMVLAPVIRNEDCPLKMGSMSLWKVMRFAREVRITRGRGSMSDSLVPSGAAVSAFVAVPSQINRMKQRDSYPCCATWGEG